MGNRDQHAQTKSISGHRFTLPVLRLGLLLAVVTSLSVSSTQAQHRVSGTVTSEGGPLPGVNIVIKGTAIGTTSNVEGYYELQAPVATDTLVFSFVGFVAQEVPIEGRSSIDVEMSADIEALEEVLVVGYGTQRARNVTGAIASVTSENIEELPVTGPDQALAGQIAGVHVNQGNGIPGGGAQVQIRGVGAIGAGAEPLYVVDGFPLSSGGEQVRNPLNDIRPEDIESISILKDASAAAIYGSRAANGVVLITTKTGLEQTPEFGVTLSTGVQQIPEQNRPDMMNAAEFAQFQKERIEDQIRYEQGREPTPEDIPEAYRNPEALGEGVNWFEEITRPAPMQEISAFVSGGTRRVSAYVSGGYLRQAGVVEFTDYDRFSLRANVRASLSERLRVGLNVSPTYSVQNLPTEGGGGIWTESFGQNAGAFSIGQALVLSPIGSVRDENGNYVPMVGSPGTFLFPNPVQALDALSDETTVFRTIATSFAEYDLAEGLTLRTSLNADRFSRRIEIFRPSVIGSLFSPPPRIPSGALTEMSYLNWLNENTLSFSRTFGMNHSLDLLAGTSVQVQNTESNGFTGEEFPDDDIQALNAAARVVVDPGQTFIEVPVRTAKSMGHVPFVGCRVANLVRALHGGRPMA